MSFGKGGGGSKIPSKEEHTGQKNPITWYKSKVGKYPSNVQTWWSMKRPVQATPDNLQKSYLEVFDPKLRNQITYGNTLAPKGHYIYDAFKVDRSAVSGVEGLESESSDGARPRATAFYAGRVFYAGTRASKWGSRIYFSQILERPTQVGECYQMQDPTSEDVPDLLPSDGGVIVIPDIAEVIKLYAYGDGLFAFATNGVWKISGPDGGGFKANDYSVSKMSTAAALGPYSFVETEQGLLWWNRSGIWVIAPDQTGLSVQVTSLTDSTIKEFFDDIPDESKKYAKGAYNNQSKIVQWIYRSTAPTDIEEKFGYNRILNLDTRTGAFYPWKPIADDRDSALELSGIIALAGDATVQTNMEVWADGEQVVIYNIVDVFADGDQVFADGEDVVAGDTDSGDEIEVLAPLVTRTSVENRFKYLVFIKEII